MGKTNLILRAYLRTHEDIWLRCCRPLRKPSGVARGECGNRSTSACSKAALIMVGCILRASTGLDVSKRGCINCSCTSGDSGSDGKPWMSNVMPEARLLPRAPIFDRGNRPQPQSCSCTSPMPVVDFFAKRLTYANRALQSR